LKFRSCKSGSDKTAIPRAWQGRKPLLVIPREGGVSSTLASCRVANARQRLLDHPPELVIGPATWGRTRWRMMTKSENRND
jgi:hypothetical protein